MFKSYENSRIGSVFIVTDCYRESDLHHYSQDEFLKIIWNRGDCLSLELDEAEVSLEKNRLLFVTPPLNPVIHNREGEYLLLYFNREFYCIHDNAEEVSCDGLLFWGSSEYPVLGLSDDEAEEFKTLYGILIDELDMRDHIQDEMLRVLLKRLLIKSVRLYRRQSSGLPAEEGNSELIRRFSLLVEKHFRECHRVSAYAGMLHKSPKTLANIFAEEGWKTPLEAIHDRIVLEGKRQLLKTDKRAKEISYELGFESPSLFSRFFKNKTGLSPLAYRQQQKEKNQGEIAQL